MLKFFRQYNKYILSVGVALLMIAFLIQPTLSMFAPSPGNRTIGTIGDTEITLQDQRQAGTTLRAGANCRLGLFHEISRDDAAAIIEGPQKPPPNPLPMPEPEEIGESGDEPEST